MLISDAVWLGGLLLAVVGMALHRGHTTVGQGSAVVAGAALMVAACAFDLHGWISAGSLLAACFLLCCGLRLLAGAVVYRRACRARDEAQQRMQVAVARLEAAIRAGWVD